MKKNKIIVISLTVLAALSIIFLIFATNYVKYFKPEGTTKKPDTVDVSDYTFETSKYSAAVKGSGSTQLPIIPTDIDGVYYSMNTEGVVTFYALSGSSFVHYTQGVSSFETKVTCSNQDIPVSMYCVEKDSQVCGYGLFTSRKTPGVKIFDYAFCKITAMPKAFGDKGSLMLVSLDKTEFALKNKTYSEAFSFDMSSKKTGSPVFTNNGRLTGLDGALRDDWIKLTDNFIRSLGTEPYFVTGREYNIGVTETKNDIMQRNGSNKSKTVVSGIVGSWARGVNGGIAYIRSTNIGFESVSTLSAAPVASFAGDYFTDYVHSGNYLLKKSDLTLTDLLTGKSVQISGVTFSGEIVTFAVNPSGTAAVIVSGKDIAAAQTIAVCDLTTGAVESVSEPLLFAVDYPEINWISDTVFIHTRPVVNDGSQLNYVVYERGGLNAEAK